MRSVEAHVPAVSLSAIAIMTVSGVATQQGHAHVPLAPVQRIHVLQMLLSTMLIPRTRNSL